MHSTITTVAILLLAGLGLSCRAPVPNEQIAPGAVQTREPVSSKQTFTYKNVGGVAIQADVYRLPGPDVRPAIVWVHGGGLIFGSRGTVPEDQLSRFLAAGYVLIAIDYRLAPESKLPAIIEDLQDAWRWVHSQGPELFRIHPERIAVMGGSAGGYLTLMAGFCLEPRPRALVSFYGYGDIIGEWYTRPHPGYLALLGPINKEDADKSVGEIVLTGSPVSPRRYFYYYCRQNGIWPKAVVALDPDKEPEKFARFCPVRHVTKDYPPTLLLHGDRDIDVPFAESERMAEALQRHQVTHRLIRMTNYNHLFDRFSEWPPKGPPVGLKDPKVAEVFDAVVTFLNEHLGR